MSNKIQFKKNIGKLLKITDIPKQIFIDHPYFSLLEEDFPFDSFQFKRFLQNRNITVIDIGEAVKKADFFKEFLVEDKELKEKIKEIKTKEEDWRKLKAKENKKEVAKEARKKIKEAKERAEREKKKVEIISNEDFENSF